MPMTTNKSLLRLFANSDTYLKINTGRAGGFACLVGCGILASDGDMGGCKHLLAESLDRPALGDWTSQGETADQYLLVEEWVPVLTAQDEPSSTWWAWFAVPVSALRSSDDPLAAAERLAASVQEEFDEVNRENDEDEDDEDDDDDDDEAV
jgi:hypothetical protein